MTRTSKPRRARRWRRWLVTLFLALLVAAALLPRITSGPRLARFVAERAALATDVPVQIGDVQWGWWSGIVIKDISAAAVPGKSSAQVSPPATSPAGVDLKEVAIQASLWDLLVNKTVEQVRLSDVTLDLDLSVPFAPPAENGPLPLAVHQIVLNRCYVNLHDPVGDPVQLYLPTAMVELDRKSGVVNWRLTARMGTGGLLASEGQFVLPRLATGRVDLRGVLKLAWTDISLQALPASVLNWWQLKQLAGTVNGSLNVELSQDWTLTYDVATSISSLAVAPAVGKEVRLTEAAVSMAGEWQMIDQRVRVQTLRARLDGMVLESGAPALIYDGQSNHMLQANLSCRVLDAQQLRQTIEHLGVTVSPELSLTGSGAIDVHVGRAAAATIVQLTIAGESLAGRFGPYYAHDAGQPLGANVICRLQDDGSLDVQSASVDLPGGRVRAAARLISAKGESSQELIFQDGQVQLEWQDFERLAAQAPLLLQRLAPAVHLQGAGRVKVEASRAAEELSAHLELDLPHSAQVTMADWLHKPASRDLRLNVTARLGRRYDWLAVDQIRVSSSKTSSVDRGQPAEAVSGSTDVLLVQDIHVSAHRSFESGHPMLGWDLRGDLVGLDVGTLADLSPRLTEDLAPLGATGRVAGQARVNVLVDASGPAMRLRSFQAGGEIRLDEMAISTADVFQKRSGDPLRLAGSASYQWNSDGRAWQGYGSASIDSQGFTSQICYQKSPDASSVNQWAWGWLDLKNIHQATRMFPALAARVKENSIGGALSARWEWARHRETFDLDLGLDLTGMHCDPTMLRIQKRAGLPARLDMTISGPADNAAGAVARLWRVPKVQLVLSKSRADIVDAQLEITEPWARLLAGQGLQAMHMLDAAWPVRRASGRLTGTTVLGPGLASVSSDVEDLIEKYNVAGPLVWTLDWQYGLGQGIACTATADAGNLAVRDALFDKPAGVPLSATLKGNVQIDTVAGRQALLSLDVAEVKGQLADLTWAGASTAKMRLVKGQWQPHLITVSGKFDSPALENLTGLFGPAKVYQLQGHVAAEGAARFDEQTGWLIQDLDIGLWPLECQVQGMPCHVLGGVNLQGRSARATGLEFAVGKTYGSTTFEGTLTNGALDGQIGLALENLDIEEIIQQTKKPPDTGTSADKRELAEKSSGPLEVMGWGRSRIMFMGSADRVVAPIAPDEPAAVLNALAWRGSVEKGALSVDLAGAFEGGPLAADVRGDLVDPSVPLKIHYRADPTDLTRNMVVKGFPGMTVDGPVTLDETLTIDRSKQSPATPSAGELIVEGGIVRGTAAPKWVTRLFPGLELASFKFNRMHNWYERDADGKTVNRIIFRGSPWSMYMNGYSLLDGTMRYEVGVDLLGPAESEYWATADRARLALFIKTGKVVNGKIEREVVRFLNPQQIAGRLLKDNLLTITYHALRQQITGSATSATDKELLSSGNQ